MPLGGDHPMSGFHTQQASGQQSERPHWSNGGATRTTEMSAELTDTGGKLPDRFHTQHHRKADTGLRAASTAKSQNLCRLSPILTWSRAVEHPRPAPGGIVASFFSAQSRLRNGRTPTRRRPTASGEDQTVTTLGAPYQSPISKPASSKRQKNGARQGGSARALTSPLTAVRFSSFGIRRTACPLSIEKPVTQNSGYARSSRFASLIAASTDGASYSLMRGCQCGSRFQPRLSWRSLPTQNDSRPSGKSVSSAVGLTCQQLRAHSPNYSLEAGEHVGPSVPACHADRKRESAHQYEAEGPSRIEIEPASRHELETQVAVDQPRQAPPAVSSRQSGRQILGRPCRDWR